jgi:UDP-N-acetylglucosamine acyltransferase
MAVEVHPLSVVEPGAQLGENVKIGPFCRVGPLVKLGDGVVLRSHVCVDGATTVGPRCEIWPFASVGTKTQDLKYVGGDPRLSVGADTVIRECATVSCATAPDGETRVGNRCLIMAYCHVAHDCVVGDGVIMSNNATLAGHVHVGENAVIGGMAGVHQFVHIGAMCMVGGCTKLVKDVPPYMMVDGDPAKIFGPNKIGLERRGVPPETRQALRDAFKILWHSNLLVEPALAKIEADLPPSPELANFVSFVRSSERGIIR